MGRSPHRLPLVIARGLLLLAACGDAGAPGGNAAGTPTATRVAATVGTWGMPVTPDLAATPVTAPSATLGVGVSSPRGAVTATTVPATARTGMTATPAPAPTLDKPGKGPATLAPTPAGIADTIVATVKPLPNETGGGVGAVAFADLEHGWIADGRAILATSDGGRNWVKQHEAGGAVTSLDALPGGVVLGIAGDELLATGDGGQTWRRVDAKGLLPVEQGLPPVEWIDFADPARGWAGGRGRRGLFRTLDGGRNWQAVDSPCTPLGGGGRYSFINPDTGWVLCSYGGAGGKSSKAVFKTEDGGEDWELLTENTPRNEIPGSVSTASGDRDLHFLDDRHGWATGAYGLLATTDGGRSWQGVRVANIMLGEPTPIMARFVSPEQGYVLYSSALLETRDAGATWAKRYPATDPPPAYSGGGPGGMQVFDFFDGNTGVAAGTLLDKGAILRTADGGRTWRQVGTVGGEAVLDLSFPDA